MSFLSCVQGDAGAGIGIVYEAAFPYTCSEGCEARSCRTSLCCGGERSICTKSLRWYQSSRESEQQQQPARAFSIFSVKMHILCGFDISSYRCDALRSWAELRGLGAFLTPEALSATLQACSFVSAKGFVVRILYRAKATFCCQGDDITEI